MTILSQQVIECRENVQEFWSGDDILKNTWRSLPYRIYLLVRRMSAFHYKMRQNRDWSDEDPLFLNFCKITTAAIFANQPKPKLLLSSIEGLFVASLTYHCVDDDGARDEEYPKIFHFADEKLVFDYLRQLQWIRAPSISPLHSYNVDTTPLTTSLLYEPLMKALHTVLMKKVRTTISGNYDNENEEISFASISECAGQNVLFWILEFICGVPVDDEERWDACSLHTLDLQPLVADCYWSVRLDEMFDIITSYPESLPAVKELQSVWAVLLEQGMDLDASEPLERRMQELSQSLRDSFVRRLNHPGADTTQLIDVYIAAIQVLRQLLEGLAPRNQIHTYITYTTEPVRSYLRHYRNDTVRCILTSLTNHNSQSSSSMPNPEGNTHVLYQELRRQDTKPLEYVVTGGEDAEDDEGECPTLDWQPRPSIHSYAHHQQQQQRYHRSSSSGGTSKDSDILAMLVGIYGSKELFVNEYRSMLADKMLSNLEYNTDNDVHTLELLKLRFGEMSLINAEVMIKDIEDSARLNKNVRDASLAKYAATEAASKVVVDAAVVSHIFWPKLPNGPLKHHPRIQVLLDEYAAIYAEQKNPRTLHWLHHLGSLQMELDVLEESPDGISTSIETKEFTCSPFLATLISHFEDEPTWSADQLSNETNVPDHIIVKQMAYWMKQRVVTHVSTSGVSSTGSPNADYYDAPTRMVYTLTSKASQTQGDENLPRNSVSMMDQEDASSGFQQLAVSSMSRAEIRDLHHRYASYILIMLTNLQNATIQNIHEMLGVMSSQSDASAYDLSLADLHSILQNLCRQNKLECGRDGRYKLIKR
jgi:anaphase-promoting complex subunit 2